MKKNVSDVGSARLQRLKLKLLKYDLDVEYMPGKLLYVADTLSRLYLNETTKEDNSMNEIVHTISKCVNLRQIDRDYFTKELEIDDILNKVKTYYFRGWPKVKR